MPGVVASVLNPITVMLLAPLSCTLPVLPEPKASLALVAGPKAVVLPAWRMPELIVVVPVYRVLAPASLMVPGPTMVRLLVPASVPLRLSALPLATVHVWLPPRRMLAPMVVVAFAVELTVMPLPSVLPLSVVARSVRAWAGAAPMVTAVASLNVRLLTVMSESKVILPC